MFFLLFLKNSLALGDTLLVSLTLLDDVELDALGLGEGDERGVTLANDEDVAETSGELVATSVLDVDDLEGTGVLLTTDNGTDTANVTPASDHDCVADLELDVADDLAGGNVDLDGIVGADGGVGVTDGAGVVGGDEGDALLADLDLLDAAELVLSLLSLDGEDGEAALDVIEETEVLAGLVDGDDIHEAGGEVSVGADLAVNLDETLHHDVGDLTTGESVFQTVAEEEHERKALTELVGASGSAGGVGATELIEHPVLGCCKSLEMMLGTTCLKNMKKKLKIFCIIIDSEDD